MSKSEIDLSGLGSKSNAVDVQKAAPLVEVDVPEKKTPLWKKVLVGVLFVCMILIFTFLRYGIPAISRAQNQPFRVGRERFGNCKNCL